jgi:hypothetical protein
MTPFLAWMTPFLAAPDVTAVDEGVPEAVPKEFTALGHTVRVMRLGNAHGLTVECDANGSPQGFAGGTDPGVTAIEDPLGSHDHAMPWPGIGRLDFAISA